MTRIRAFLVSQGRPRANVMVEINVELLTGDNPTPLPTLLLQSDHVGFVAASLPEKIKPEHVWLYPVAEPTEQYDIWPSLNSGLDDAVAVIEIPPGIPEEASRLYPAIIGSNLGDTRISPYSFSMQVDFSIGQGVCETLVPSAIAERTFRFNQIVLDTSTTSETTSPATGGGNELPPFEKYRRGVLVQYEMQWFPLGHGLGEIVYTLPLAPCESVNVAVVDWSRQDTASRLDDVQAGEDLVHDQRRDRTIDETVASTLREWQQGNSVSIGGSLGIGGSGVSAAVTGGASWTSSRGGRNLTGQSQQSLADSVVQASSLVRGLHSTVVVQASQAERDIVQTRTVTNHNHCHALTVLYYEVLRQYRTATRVAVIRDVLLLKMAQAKRRFNRGTALAFRPFLEPHLLEPELQDCFDALARLEYTPETDDTASPSTPTEPESAVISELIVSVYGPGPDEGIPIDSNELSDVYFLVQRDDLSNHIRYWVSRGLPRALPGSGARVRVTINPSDTYGGFQNEILETLPPLTVDRIARVGVNTFFNGDVFHSSGDAWHLGRLIVEYRLEGEGAPRLLYDSSDPSYGTPIEPLPYYFTQSQRPYGGGLGAPWFSPDLRPTEVDDSESPTIAEPQGPSQKTLDEICAGRLLNHLDSHRAYYWRQIWMSVDAGEYARIFDEVALAEGTLLDHVDFNPIAVIGDYVVFPMLETNSDLATEIEEQVAQLDPTEQLISLPTRGVFAEAKLSHCNACEERDVTRFWDWTESPCPDDAPAITGVTPGSRAQNIIPSPTSLPNPVVNIVNPPAAPDPTGLSQALSVIGTPNIFRDMSGSSDLNTLLRGLAADTISQANARQQAQRLLQSGSSGSGSSTSSGAGTTSVSGSLSAREAHDRIQVTRNAMRAGNISEESGNEAIESFVRYQAPITLGSGEEEFTSERHCMDILFPKTDDRESDWGVFREEFIGQPVLGTNRAGSLGLRRWVVTDPPEFPGQLVDDARSNVREQFDILWDSNTLNNQRLHICYYIMRASTGGARYIRMQPVRTDVDFSDEEVEPIETHPSGRPIQDYSEAHDAIVAGFIALKSLPERPAPSGGELSPEVLTWLERLEGYVQTIDIVLHMTLPSDGTLEVTLAQVRPLMPAGRLERTAFMEGITAALEVWNGLTPAQRSASRRPNRDELVPCHRHDILIRLISLLLEEAETLFAEGGHRSLPEWRVRLDNLRRDSTRRRTEDQERRLREIPGTRPH